MNQLLKSTHAACYNGRSLCFEVTITEGCGQFFFELLLRDYELDSKIISRFIVSLKPDEVVDALLNGTEAAKEALSNRIRSPRGADVVTADVLQRILDFKKDDRGLWVPKFKPGDVVIVDRLGSPEIKVLDADDGSYERVPKSPTEATQSCRSCTCPARDLLTKGCSCGGKRPPPGLRDLPQ